MSKIKIKASALDELRRVVKNYNAKVKRNIGKTNVYQPGKISFRTLKKALSSTSEARKTIRSLKEYTKKGAEVRNIVAKTRNEKGKITYQSEAFSLLEKKQMLKGRKMARDIMKKEMKEIEKAGYYYGKEKMPVEKSPRWLSLKMKIKMLSGRLISSNLEKLQKMIATDWRKRAWVKSQMKESYFKQMDYLVRASGYDYQKYREITEKLDAETEPDEFMEMYQSDLIFKTLSEFYEEQKALHKNELDDVQLPIKEAFDTLHENLDYIIKRFKKP